MIADKKNTAHYLWGDNCDSWVLVNTEELSVKQESMPTGTKERLHFHEKAQQFFYILKGIATFYVDGKPQIVNASQGFIINAKTQHYIANETQNQLDFLVISQPTTNNDRIMIE